MINSTLPIAKIDNMETATTHEIETAFFTSIARGSVEDVNTMIKLLLKSGIVVNKLSKDDINTIAIATRYAIAGGADETACYNFTDEAIMQIDSLTDESEILQFLFKKSLQLTATVNKIQENNQPKAVRQTLKFISNHLFDDLRLDVLAKECGLSKDHLSLLFKKSVGTTIPQYIKRQRLEVAKTMLQKGLSLKDVAEKTSFSTESYFIKCFKDEFHVTPGEFIK